MPQVTPNCHQASVCKIKLKTAIATWNIRTKLLKGKLENIKQEMKSMKNNILGEAEEVDPQWVKFKVAMTEAAVEQIPRVPKSWMIEDILDLMGKRG